MTNDELYDNTDAELAYAIEYCRTKWIESQSVDEGAEWKHAYSDLLSEQRHRRELMLNDETDAVKSDLERNKFEQDKKQSKIETALKILGVIIGLGEIGCKAYDTYATKKSKALECKTKLEFGKMITDYEKDGNIPYQQANKFQKY